MEEQVIREGSKINNRYVIRGVIGKGGGGIVYRAFDMNLQNDVVVKQIREKAASLLESRTEADILKQLKHENLPKVLDFFELDGRVYTVMDFIKGVSFSEALRRHGRYPQKDVLRWAGRIADAIAYLHAQNPPVIHSDIKPGNIMMDPETGNVCLIDFNISLVFSGNRIGSTWISSGYSPPEQYVSLKNYYHFLDTVSGRPTKNPEQPGALPGTGKAAGGTGTAGVLSAPTRIYSRNTSPLLEQTVGHGVDERSDVYSFGATMYHLLTGHRPSPDFQEIVPLSAYDLDVSEGLCHIIEKCMELDPAKRYRNGQELSDAFRHIYDLDSEYRAYKKKRTARHAVCAALLISGAVLVASGFLLHRKEIRTAYNGLILSADQLTEDGKYTKADKKLDEAAALLPRQLEAYERKAVSSYRAGQYDDAVERALTALGDEKIRIADGDKQTLADLYYVLGNAYLEQKSYNDAAGAFKKAIDTYGGNNLYYRDYAICLARAGDTARAEKILKKAKDSNLDEDSVAYTEGEIARMNGETDRAEEDFRKTLSVTKDKELKQRAVFELAGIYDDRKDPDGKIAFLQEQYDEAEESAKTRISKEIADTWILKGNQDPAHLEEYDRRALDEYTKLYQAGFNSIGNLENMAILYQNLKQYDEAEQILQEMTDKYPKDYRGFKRAAFLSAVKEAGLPQEQRDYSQFKANCEKALQLYEAAGSGNDPEMAELKDQYDSGHAGGWY